MCSPKTHIKCDIVTHLSSSGSLFVTDSLTHWLPPSLSPSVPLPPSLPPSLPPCLPAPSLPPSLPPCLPAPFVSFFPSLHMPVLHGYFLHDYCQGCNTLHCSSHTLSDTIFYRSLFLYTSSPLLGLLFLPMSQTIRPHWPDWCTIPSSSASLVPFYHTTLRYTSSKNTLQANHAGNNLHCVFCSLF